MKKSLVFILTLSLLGCSTTKPTPTITSTQPPTIDPTMEPSLFDITDVTFVCGEQSSTSFIFYEDSTFLSYIYEFDTEYTHGTYDQIDDTIYELYFDGFESKEYFIFNPQTYEAYQFFDSSYSLDDLHDYSSPSIKHGCITYPPFDNKEYESSPPLGDTLAYTLSEIDFLCSEEKITYTFDSITLTFKKTLSTSSIPLTGTYTVSETNTYTSTFKTSSYDSLNEYFIYELTFDNEEITEYFTFNPDNLDAFALFLEPVTFQELKKNTTLSSNHGCIGMYNQSPSDNRYGHSYSIELSNTLDRINFDWLE